LLYILEEYLLSGLIPNEVEQFLSIIIDCYIEAEDLEGEDKEKLKIAALSFQITLITKYDLQQVNSDRMLQLILKDFVNFDLSVITATIHNSLISIINRYLILYQQAFFGYLSSVNVPLSAFLEAYFKNMSFLTSHTAMYQTYNVGRLTPLLSFHLLTPSTGISYSRNSTSYLKSSFQRFKNMPLLSSPQEFKISSDE